MLGVLIGDVAGSIYEVEEVEAIKEGRKNGEVTHRSYEERMKIMNPQTSLFNEKCSATDDTVLSCALCDALLHDKDYKKYLLEYGTKEINLGVDAYGRSRFGKGFTAWIENGGEGQASFGNGSAMRVAPIGWKFDTLEETLEEAKLSAIPSHDTEEGIKGAQAVAASIFLLRYGYSKKELKNYIEENFDYDLNKDIEDLRHNYTFDSTCQGSVPEAIYCFLESNSFEDGIRKALSIGGDADTIAAICGGLGEAYYGVDRKLVEKALKYCPDYVEEVLRKFYDEINMQNSFYFGDDILEL